MDLVALIKQSGVRTAPDDHHHARDGWLQFNCPFCSAPTSDKYHMGLNIRYLYVNCWKCGFHNLADTLELILRIDRQKSRRLAAESKRGLIVEFDNKSRPAARLEFPERISDLRKAHIRYLKGRNFDPAELERLWSIQGIGLAEELAWRIFIPIIYRGETVSWTTRSVRDDIGNKYMTAKKKQELIHHKNLLYGEDYCRNTIVIHEGPLDVWNVGPGTVSTFGVDYSREQILRIAKYFRRIICFDSSEDAQRRARQLAIDIDMFGGETYNVELDAEDPGSAARREVKRLRKFAFREY